MLKCIVKVEVRLECKRLRDAKKYPVRESLWVGQLKCPSIIKDYWPSVRSVPWNVGLRFFSTDPVSKVFFTKFGLKPSPITFISAYEYMYWARSISVISNISLIISFQGPAQVYVLQCRLGPSFKMEYMFQSAQDPAPNPRGKSVCLGQIWTQLLISVCPYRLSPRSSFSTSICPGSRSVPSSRMQIYQQYNNWGIVPHFHNPKICVYLRCTVVEDINCLLYGSQSFS